MKPQGLSLLRDPKFDSIEEYLEKHSPTPLTIEEHIQKMNDALEKQFSEIAQVTNHITQETAQKFIK